MIAFTQYLRPDGERRAQFIDMPADIETLAAKVIAAGLRFECEELTTGEVSLTVFDPELEQDIAIEICANGPAVPDAVARLTKAAAAIVAAERAP